MPNQHRVFPAVLLTLAVPGCFSPLVEPIDSATSSGTETTTEGSSTDPTAGTTDPDSSTGAVDSTGPADTPPQITAFTVDGSTMPAEQQLAGLVAFDVDATDDVGIDRVEFYDDGELIATTTSSPYRTEVLVSSADNGSHSYTAVVFDTAEQTDESEVVPMSVNVVGGEILELREDIGDFRLTPPLLAIPRISASSPTDLLITASFREDVPLDPRYGITAISYSDTLSLQWSDELLPDAAGLYITFANGGKPAPSPSMAGSWLLGGAMYGQGVQQNAVFTIDETSQSISNIVPLGMIDDQFMTPVAVDISGDVLLSPLLGVLDKRPLPDAMPTWSVPIGGGNAPISHIFTDQEDIVIILTENNCAPMANRCVQKLSPDGTVLWTRPIPPSSNTALPSAAMSVDGNLAVALNTEDYFLQLLVLDPNGDTISNSVLTEDSFYKPWDLSYDPQGSLLITGDFRTAPDDLQPEAWAARIDEQGQILWLQIYAFANEHGVTGITTTPSGKAFAVGWEDHFDADFVGFSARGWVAELGL